MSLRAFRPESPEQIVPFLEPANDYPQQGVPERRLVLEGGYDPSMLHAWRSLGFYGLTRELKGEIEHRSLRRGSVHHASMLVGTQPQHVAVTLDGIRYDDRFEDIEPSNVGIVYATCVEPVKHREFIVASAIFSYLNQEDFATNPNDNEILRIQEEFYRKDPLDLGELQQTLAVGSARRKKWGV